MIVFDYLTDKELFEVKHREQFTRRYLTDRMNTDAEKTFIELLTVRAGIH